MEFPLEFNPHREIAYSLTTSALVVMGIGLGIDKVKGQFIRQLRQNHTDKYIFIFNYDNKCATWLFEECIQHHSYSETALRRPGVYIVEPGKSFLTDLSNGKIAGHHVAAIIVNDADQIRKWQDEMAIEHFRRFMPVRST